jgi:glycosyltransferase involved in cell wall biosynthesis
MPSYNHSKYIREAIESVLGQTYPDLELIIVDDASQDNSAEIIETYVQADRRVRFFRHSSNLGIAQTVNDGINEARGDFIALASSDDIWLPLKLEKQLKILKADSSVVVWAEGMLIDSDGNALGRTFSEYHSGEYKKKSGDIFLSLVGGNYVASQSLIFSRVECGPLRFRKCFIYLNDFVFNLELSARLPFRFIEEPLFKYRLHDTNTIRVNRDIWNKDSFLANRFILSNFSDRLSRKIKAKIYSRIGKHLYEQKHFSYSARIYLKSICFYPFKTSYYKSLLRCYRENSKS